MGWLKAGVIAAAIACFFLPLGPSFIERWYSTGFYPVLQRLLTPISNLIPFALFDLLTLVAAVLAVRAIVRAIRQARQLRRWQPLWTTTVNLATAAAAIYLVFLVVWGFNYRRVPMSARRRTPGGR